ncbi:hypothetical protein IFR05_002045 [Cadophora sp. M221]|nr:hypothetical protein IFR05_002045 [Cadophora sp. M221]
MARSWEFQPPPFDAQLQEIEDIRRTKYGLGYTGRTADLAEIKPDPLPEPVLADFKPDPLPKSDAPEIKLDLLPEPVLASIRSDPLPKSNEAEIKPDPIKPDPLPTSDWDFETIVKSSPEQLTKEAVDKELEGWPWKECSQKLLTLGPFAFNYAADGGANTSPRFKLPQASQKSPLFTKMFTNDVVARTLLRLIFQNHSSAWQFWSTCQEMTHVYDSQVHLWDMTGTFEDGGYFHNCEKPRYGPDAPTHPWDQGSVSPIIVIAPYRRPSGPPSYFEQIRNVYRMSLAMSNFAENMQNLQIHRISFLTPQLLGLLIPKMTNLKVLGIYQCQLMHVAEIFRLLDIIKTDRPLGRENQISLDFFPMWHQGPLPVDDKNDRSIFFAGTYGVTWDNSDMDHCLAIWAIVMRALPLARAQNIDLVSKGTAFRQWLDKGLLWKVEKTLEAMLDPKPDVRIIAALADARNPDHGGNWRKFTSNDRIGCRPEGYEPYVKKYHCNTCRVENLGIFYKWHDLLELQAFNGNDTRLANLTCYGCQLMIICRHEKDHYKAAKRRLMKAWLHGGPGGEWNTTDLNKALYDYTARQIVKRADEMDNKRIDSMNHTNPARNYDAEYEGRQKIIPWEQYGKHGFCRRSPTADVPERTVPLDQWSRHSMDNRNAHRRW